MLVGIWEVLHLVEVEHGGVDGKAKEGRGWAIEEDSTEMGGALCALTAFMRWIVGFELGSDFVDIIKGHTFLHDSDSVVNVPPEGGVTSVGLKFVAKSEEPRLTDSAVIEPRR